MKRRFYSSVLLLIVLATACDRETRVPEAKPAKVPATVASPPASVPPTPQAAGTAAAVGSTPERCAGDGTYVAALDCLRQTRGFHFSFVEGNERAEGEMSRTAIGAERVRFRTKTMGNWIGTTKASGVVWYHEGRRSGNEPQLADTIWQQTTMVLDPQKKEGSPVAAGSETVEGVACNRFRFTDANNGDQHEVWIARTGGDLVRSRTTPAGRSNPVRAVRTLTLSHHGAAVRIEEPR